MDKSQLALSFYQSSPREAVSGYQNKHKFSSSMNFGDTTMPRGPRPDDFMEMTMGSYRNLKLTKDITQMQALVFNQSPIFSKFGPSRPNSKSKLLSPFLLKQAKNTPTKKLVQKSRIQSSQKNDFMKTSQLNIFD